MTLVERLRVPLVIEYAVPFPVAETLETAADEREEAAAELTRLQERVAELEAGIVRIRQHHEARSELYTSDAECAAGMASIATLLEAEQCLKQ